MKKVVAITMGYYANNRVRPGEVFEVPDGLNARWFKPVTEKKSVPVKKEPETLSELTKAAPMTQVDFMRESSVFDEPKGEQKRPYHRKDKDNG